MCASRDPGIAEGRDGRPLQSRRIVVVIVLRAHVVCGDQVVAAAAAAAPVVIASATVASRARETDSLGRAAGFPGRVLNVFFRETESTDRTLRQMSPSAL